MEFGKNCFKENCKKLDFLPIKCNLCGNEYCKDHSEYSSHGCTPNIEFEKLSIPLSYPCTVIDCKDKSIIPIYCNTCGRLTCIKHKQKELHKCSGLITVVKDGKPSANLVSLKEQLSKYDMTPAITSKKSLSPAQLKQKLKVNLISIKMKARSPRNCSVPTDQRCHLQISDKQTNRTMFLFVNRNWAFSRICDFVLENWTLNLSDIRVVSEFSGREVDPQMNIEELLSQEIIFDGDNILFLY